MALGSGSHRAPVGMSARLEAQLGKGLLPHVRARG